MTITACDCHLVREDRHDENCRHPRPAEMGVLFRNPLHRHSFLAALNKRGRQGWEVVNIVHYKEPKGGDMAWTAYFKRPAGNRGHGATADSQTLPSQAPAPVLPMEDIIRASSA